MKRVSAWALLIMGPLSAFAAIVAFASALVLAVGTATYWASGKVRRETMEFVTASGVAGTSDAQAIGLVLTLSAIWIFTVGVIFILVRGLVRTIRIHQPFDLGNIRRLRLIALMLLLVQVDSSAITWAASTLSTHNGPSRLGFDITGWLSVIIVFALTEVFREGVRLRQDADLTI